MIIIAVRQRFLLSNKQLDDNGEWCPEMSRGQNESKPDSVNRIPGTNYPRQVFERQVKSALLHFKCEAFWACCLDVGVYIRCLMGSCWLSFVNGVSTGVDSYSYVHFFRVLVVRF